MSKRTCQSCGHVHRGSMSCWNRNTYEDPEGKYELDCHCLGRDVVRPKDCHCPEACRNEKHHEEKRSYQSHPYFCQSCNDVIEDRHSLEGKCLYSPGKLKVFRGCRHCWKHNGVTPDNRAKLGYTNRWGFFCSCPLGLRVMKYYKEKLRWSP
jgi:hypothetical protein